MLCKACGRTLQRKNVWWVLFKEQRVIETLCQRCRGWLATGRVYDVRQDRLPRIGGVSG